MDRLALNVDCPPPPDLTPQISKEYDQYIAGGGFGDVYRCLYHHDSLSTQVAVKALRFRFALDGDNNNNTRKMLRRELGIWRRLNHDNVVPFLGIAYGFGMHGAMSLVSLWMPNGSLHHFLEKYNHNLGVGHRLQFLLDTANGLHYLHSLQIVHGDLNCNNVLLDESHTARLADFGYASYVGKIPEAFSYLQRSTSRPGALRWIAPEQIETEETCTRTIKSDIYSFGCVALQVLSGKEPWSEVRQDAAVVLRLSRGEKPSRPEAETLHDSHWNFIQGCWSGVEERPSAKVAVLSVQRFLRHCSESEPLQDAVSGQTDSLVAEPGAYSSVPPGSYTVNFAAMASNSDARGHLNLHHDDQQSLQSNGYHVPFFDPRNSETTPSVLPTAHQPFVNSYTSRSLMDNNSQGPSSSLMNGSPPVGYPFFQPNLLASPMNTLTHDEPHYNDSRMSVDESQLFDAAINNLPTNSTSPRLGDAPLRPQIPQHGSIVHRPNSLEIDSDIEGLSSEQQRIPLKAPVWICEWTENGVICGREVTRATLSRHLSIHGIKNLSRVNPTTCNWAGCEERVFRNGESIVWHIREVHLYWKRRTKRVHWQEPPTYIDTGLPLTQ